MTEPFDAVSYKKNMVRTWDELAPRYHDRWIDRDMGPFHSGRDLVRLAGVKRGDRVLDVACGTGAVTAGLVSAVGPDGLVVGADASSVAISIARRQESCRDAEFVCMDAEEFCFGRDFDVVTCQLGLFFLIDSAGALRNMHDSLRDGGRLAVSVHEKNTPFYDSVVGAVRRFVPSYITAGAPDLDRLGSADVLAGEAAGAGFSDIRTEMLEFEYAAGTFESYWEQYRQYIPSAQRAKLDELSPSEMERLQDAVMENTLPYTDTDGKIVFPWRILALTARR